MADRGLGFWQYVKGAFNARATVPGLGAVPFNWLYLLSVGVLGLAAPGFWLIGMGLEVGYLALLSDNPRFRKWMDAMALVAQRGDWSQRKQVMLGALSEDKRARYEALERKCVALAGPGGGKDPEPSALDLQAYTGLSWLLWIFLKLLTSLQQLENQLRTSSPGQIEREIAAYEDQLKRSQDDPAKERIAKSLQATLDITRKRLDNVRSAGEKGEFIRAELERIEQQVTLMIEESALNKDASFLSDRVDAVASTLNETGKWMRANAELLGEGAQELDAPPPILAAQVQGQ